jgi:hypothetical protein
MADAVVTRALREREMPDHCSYRIRYTVAIHTVIL